MFNRQLYSELTKWASKPKHKPLVLRGARQVGKTTLIEAFANEFDRFIDLNLEKKEHRELFEADNSFSEILSAIFFYSGHSRDQKRTLIFIDEIQNSPKAVSLLRYFYEETPELFVISAGSLLENLIDEHISFPVGRVEYLTVRPCSFHEFLAATKDTAAIEILNEKKIPEFAHGKLMKYFNEYVLVGGMPEAVAEYLEGKDMIAVNNVYNSLLTGYRDDVEKYASSKSMTQIIRHILKSGMLFAGERIKFQNFGESDYRSREVGEAFRTLEKAMLLELVHPCTGQVIPLIPDLKKSPRLHWLDTGLVAYAAGIQKEIFGSKDISHAWKGRIAEHIVGQEILALDNNVLTRRHFWVREAKNSNAEVDYLYPFNGQIIPIEVKSGEGSRLLSLHLFMDSAPHNVAVRVWSSPMSINEVSTQTGKNYTLISIPFYLVHRLPAILEQYL